MFIEAFDARSGAKQWHSAGLGVGDGAGPIILGDVMYCTGYLEATGANVYALNRADGTQRWHNVLMQKPGIGDLVLSGQTLYATYTDLALTFKGIIHDSLLVAFDAADGHVLWRSTIPQMGGSVQVLDGQIYITGSPHGAPGPTGSLLALSPTDGHLLWQASLPGDPYSKPILVDGRVVLSVDGGWVAAFDPATGAAAWRVHPRGWEAGVSTVATDGRSIFVAAGRIFSALAPSDGTQRWRKTVDGGPDRNHQMYAPAFADGILYGISGNDTYVYALDPANGNVRWRYDDIGYTRGGPVTDHGMVYLIKGDGPVVALRESDGALAAQIDTDQTYPQALAVAQD